VGSLSFPVTTAAIADTLRDPRPRAVALDGPGIAARRWRMYWAFGRPVGLVTSFGPGRTPGLSVDARGDEMTDDRST